MLHMAPTPAQYPDLGFCLFLDSPVMKRFLPHKTPGALPPPPCPETVKEQQFTKIVKASTFHSTSTTVQLAYEPNYNLLDTSVQPVGHSFHLYVVSRHN